MYLKNIVFYLCNFSSLAYISEIYLLYWTSQYILYIIYFNNFVNTLIIVIKMWREYKELEKMQLKYLIWMLGLDWCIFIWFSRKRIGIEYKHRNIKKYEKKFRISNKKVVKRNERKRSFGKQGKNWGRKREIRYLIEDNYKKIITVYEKIYKIYKT